MLAAEFLLIRNPKTRLAHRNGDAGSIHLDVEFFHPASLAEVRPAGVKSESGLRICRLIWVLLHPAQDPYRIISQFDERVVGLRLSEITRWVCHELGHGLLAAEAIGLSPGQSIIAKRRGWRETAQ